MTLHFANGIASHGEGNTDILMAEMKALGYAVNDINQQIRHFWDVRWTAKQDAIPIIEAAKDGDSIFGHSYAGLKVAIAMQEVSFSSVFLIRPAMSRNYDFPGWQDTRIYCIYSRGDMAILAGSLLRFDHPFGAAGRKGFKTPYVTNIPSRGGHNEDFEPDNVGNWARFYHKELQKIGQEKLI